jgi:transposase
LRAIRTLTDQALAELSRDFNKIYSRDGRLSIPPERPLRVLLLQAFYTVRSERQLMEQLDFNLLFRYGTPPCSARTGTGCLTVASPPSS